MNIAVIALDEATDRYLLFITQSPKDDVVICNGEAVSAQIAFLDILFFCLYSLVSHSMAFSHKLNIYIYIDICDM